MRVYPDNISDAKFAIGGSFNQLTRINFWCCYGGRASVTNAMKIVLDDIFKAGQSYN